jgi:hypothetical protein
MSQETVTLPQPGGCLCGAVRYRLTAAPLSAYVCHCHVCQTRSGAAFTLTLVVRTADLAFEGPSQVVTRTTPSGREMQDTICLACRTLMRTSNPETADFSTIRAGTLDDAGWVRPAAQTWVESAIPWAVIPDVPNLAWADFNHFAVGAQWQATAPKFVEG